MRRDPDYRAARTRRLAARTAGLLRAGHGREQGQSVVEVALIIPVAMLMVAGALDMGRLFYARVSIENAAREGAVFAARNPGCDTSVRSDCEDPNTADWHVRNEVSSLHGLVTSFSCMEGSTPRASVEDCQAGDTYVVTVQDQFDFITPVLEPILGSSISLQASASAPVLNGAFDTSAAFASFVPDDSNATPTPTPSESPSSSPTATPPGAYCSVANLVGIKKNSAGSAWVSAGLSGSIINEGGSGNYTIGWQSLTPGAPELCTSSITISQSAPDTTPTPSPTPTPTPSPTPTPTPSPTPTPTPSPTPTPTPSPTPTPTPSPTPTPTPSPTPTPTPSPTPTPTPSPTPTPTPSPTPTPTPSPTPTPTPSCTVPDFHRVRVNQAERRWVAAGFNGDFDRVGRRNFRVKHQDLAPGVAPCDSDITVYKVAR